MPTESENKNMKVCFVYPYFSYERGTNEKTNNTDKKNSMNVREKEISKIQEALNGKNHKKYWVIVYQKDTILLYNILQKIKNINVLSYNEKK